jgi:hypothetical protein
LLSNPTQPEKSYGLMLLKITECQLQVIQLIHKFSDSFGADIVVVVVVVVVVVSWLVLKDEIKIHQRTTSCRFVEGSE